MPFFFFLSFYPCSNLFQDEFIVIFLSSEGILSFSLIFEQVEQVSRPTKILLLIFVKSKRWPCLKIVSFPSSSFSYTDIGKTTWMQPRAVLCILTAKKRGKRDKFRRASISHFFFLTRKFFGLIYFLTAPQLHWFSRELLREQGRRGFFFINLRLVLLFEEGRGRGW